MKNQLYYRTPARIQWTITLDLTSRSLAMIEHTTDVPRGVTDVAIVTIVPFRCVHNDSAASGNMFSLLRLEFQSTKRDRV